MASSLVYLTSKALIKVQQRTRGHVTLPLGYIVIYVYAVVAASSCKRDGPVLIGGHSNWRLQGERREERGEEREERRESWLIRRLLQRESILGKEYV